MKRFLSLLLCVVMLASVASVFAVSGSATAKTTDTVYTIPSGATTFAADGITYTVINDQNLSGKKLTAGNYILACSAYAYGSALTLGDGVYLNGNGYFMSFDTAAVLQGCVTISNLEIGMKDNTSFYNTVTPFTIDPDWSSSLANDGDGVLITFENVHVYANINSTGIYTGGFLNTGSCKSDYSSNGTGTYVFRNCSMNGSITVTGDSKKGVGGFIGGVIGGYGDVVFENCVNNATITATGNSVGGFVGFSQASRVSLTDCVNAGAVSYTPTAGMQYSAMGGFLGFASGNVTMENCINMATLTGAAPIGGLVGWANGQYVDFDNCVNTADITATGYAWGKNSNGNSNTTYKADGKTIQDSVESVGGLAGLMDMGGAQYYTTDSSGTVSISGGLTSHIRNCANYGTLTSKVMQVGGIVGASKYLSVVSIEDTVNYGNLSSEHQRCGGIVGITSQYDQKSTEESTVTYVHGSVNLLRCVNYGNVTAPTNVGGMVGENSATLTIQYCLNTGTVTKTAANDNGGGFVGWCGTTADRPLVIENSANIGDFVMSASSYTAGRYSGIAAGGGSAVCTFTNVHYYGHTTGLNTNAFGYILGGTDCAPTAGSTGYYLHEVTGANSYTNIKQTKVADFIAVANLNNLFKETLGLSFVVENGEVVLATPVVRATQHTDATEGVQKVRFLATVNTDDYTRVGFRVTTQVAGETAVNRGSYSCKNIYGSVLANGVTVQATELHGTYIYNLTFTDVPTDKNVIFTVTPYAEVENSAGTVTATYNGKTQVIVYEGGSRVNEQKSETASGTTAITVSTYNIQTGNKTNSTNIKSIANWVKNNNVDIAGFQEVWNTSSSCSHTLLGNALGSNYTGVFQQADFRNSRKYGNSLYWNNTKYEKVSQEYVKLDWIDCTYGEDRVILVVVLKEKATGRKIAAMVTHFGLTDRERYNAVEQLRTLVDKYSTQVDGILFMGDLNHAPTATVYKRIHNYIPELNDSMMVYSDSFLRMADGTIAKTCGTNRIDYVYGTSNFVPTGCKISTITASDHYGYLVNYKW